MNEEEQMNDVLAPPRAELAFIPTPKKEDEFGDTISKVSSDTFFQAWEKATNAGQIKVEADDPRIFTAFKAANQYITDMAAAGLLTAEGAAQATAGAIGEVFGGDPENEQRLARDIMGMAESSAGYGLTKTAATVDNLVDTAGVAAGRTLERLNQPGPMPEVLGSNLGNVGQSAKPYKPSLFSAGDVKVQPGTYSVAEFYSPTVETLRNTEFPSKGYKGSELLKLLQDKTPGVRRAELNAMDLGIDPQKRYTKEEMLGLAEKRSYKVTAEVVDDPQYRDTQRQDIRDQEVDYATIKINAEPNSEEVSAFLPSRGYTHYDPNTIAHTRVSVREGQDGSEYMLVEEIQSDLLQHGAAKPRGAVSIDQAYDEVLDLTRNDLVKGEDVKATYNASQEYFDNIFKIGAENSRQFALRERGLEVPEADKARLDSLVEQTRSLSDRLYESGASADKNFQRIATSFENAGYDEGYRIERRTQPIGKSPLSEDSDAVRLSLQAAIAKAADGDVTSLVIPNVERIIASGRARPGSSQYEDYLKEGSGFQRTYVSGIAKFIKQLQSEYGDKIKVESIDLPYTKEKYYSEGQAIELPRSAIKIDFSGLGDVNFRVSRFAEGGMVEDNQMNRLMAEGGMADDGVAVEPVTGNEVPPGSLSSEVRDDIPAQLSEGEYIVPADVVRFFGVRFFEDLRSQAKQGLSEMDADGRIGGTPVSPNGVPVEGDEELSPEEEQMLREALGASGMAYGGMVDQPATTPYQDQATLYKAPVGMAEGGMTPAFDRSKFQLEETQAGNFESRKYINKTTGEERVFQFMNGIPLGIIPDGFVPAPTTAATGTPATTPAPVPSGFSIQPSESISFGSTSEKGSDRTVIQTPQVKPEGGTLEPSRWAEKNAEKIKADPYQFGVEALGDTSGRALSKGLGAVGLATGFLPAAIGGAALKAGNKIQNIAEAKAALRIMEDQGLKGSEKYQDLDTRVKSSIEDLPSFQQLLIDTGLVATADKYYKQLATPTPAATPSAGAKTPTVTTKTASGGQSDKNITATFSTERAPTTSKTIKATKAPSNLGTAFPKQESASDKMIQQSKDISAGKTAAAGKDYASKGGYSSGRATGGLVSKPTKTKKK